MKGVTIATTRNLVASSWKPLPRPRCAVLAPPLNQPRIQNTMTSSASRTRRTIGLAAWVAVVFFAAATGAAGSIRARGFYESLMLPPWAPPGWLFGPVWSTLYLMMAIAAWLVWRERGWRNVNTPLGLFLVQLGVNALWSWLFFAWHQGAWATAEILLLWTLIVVTMAMFWRIRRLAGVLLVPYLAWVSFAAVLCITVWRLNPDAL